MSELTGMTVAILATDMFEQSELQSPMEALEQAGATVHIIAPQGGTIQGAHHEQKADQFEVDKVLSEVRPEAYDAVVLPGGVMNADNLRTDEDAQDFVRAMDEAGRPIAVICHGPWLLISAGLVEGRTLTSYETLACDIRNAGGTWVDAEVVRDDNFVSSRTPDDLNAFNREMLSLLAEHKLVAA